MKTLLRSVFAAIALLAATATQSHAAFNILVQSTGGPSFSTYNSSLTANTLELLSGGVNPPFSFPGLTMSYSITNTPGSGQFVLNNLLFVYQGNPNPISLQVAITEDNANFIGNGAPLNGFASYTGSGNPSSTFSNVTTFTPGTGANNVTFSMANFPNTPTIYNGATGFTSGAAIGTIQSVFTITINPNSNVQFTAGGGFGAIGVSDATLVPIPATALLGLFAVPTLAIIRRRRKA